MQSFMIALLECSVSMTLIGLIYMAATPLLQNRFTAKGRYYTWLIMVIGLIIPFRFHPNVPIVPIDKLLAAIHNAGHASMNGAVSAASPAALSGYELAGGLWIAGLLGFIVYHVIRHRRLLFMVKRWSTPCLEQEALCVLQEVQAALNMTRRVNLRVCPGISSPMLSGFIRPVILLPSNHIPRSELQFILKHELVHLKRGDLVYKLLVFAAAALHWFNPFVYRMAKEIEFQCELSCDEEVIKHSDLNNRQQYVETIINVIKQQTIRKSAFSASFSDNRLSMKKRVQSIMDTRRKKWGFSLLFVMVIAMLGTGAVLQFSPKPSPSVAGEPIKLNVAAGSAEEREQNIPGANESSLLPTENVPTGNISTENISTENVLTENVPTESVPSRNGKGVPAASGEAQRAEDRAVRDALQLAEQAATEHLLIPEQETQLAITSEPVQRVNEPPVLFDGPGISRR